MKTTAVILAAGIGERMDLNKPKALINLDKPLLNLTLDKFESNPDINEIILVIKKDEIETIKPLITNYNKITKIIEGGATRQQSSYNGVMACNSDFILIHDVARPYVSQEIINKSIKDAIEHGVSVVGVPSKDTIKETNDEFVTKTLDRSKLFITQTPQTFKADIIKTAHEKAKQDNFTATDDVNLAERLGYKVKLTLGSYSNIKITTQEDLPCKVGIGHDSHRFKEGNNLALGGIQIPFNKTFDANSDGDVLIHALFNALTSSIGEKSISNYADDMCKKGIKDSKEYLKVALSLLQKSGYKLNNISISIEAKEPKLEQHIDKIKNSLSTLTHLPTSNIGITATSGESLSDFGKGLGMQVFAKVSVIKC